MAEEVLGWAAYEGWAESTSVGAGAGVVSIGEWVPVSGTSVASVVSMGSSVALADWAVSEGALELSPSPASGAGKLMTKGCSFRHSSTSTCDVQKQSTLEATHCYWLKFLHSISGKTILQINRRKG